MRHNGPANPHTPALRQLVGGHGSAKQTKGGPNQVSAARTSSSSSPTSTLLAVPTTSNAPIALTLRTAPIAPSISTAPPATTNTQASSASSASTASTPETSATAQASRIPVNISLAGAMTCPPSIAFSLRTGTLSKGGQGWVGGTVCRHGWRHTSLHGRTCSGSRHPTHARPAQRSRKPQPLLCSSSAALQLCSSAALQL